MGHFGDELRKEREARGVALETISEKTKVISRYLTALENENFEALPGGILSKGIVRGYARTVGLDEGAWVDRFLAASREHGTPTGDGWTEFVENVGRTRRISEQRARRRFRWTGLAVLLLLLTGFGFFVYRYVTGHVMAEELQHPTASAAWVAPDPAPASR